MTEASPTQAPGAGVTATWNYTLGSIVFLFLIIDLSIVGDTLVRVLDRPDPLLGVCVVLAVVCAGVRLRVAWFLRDAETAAAPPRTWSLLLMLTAGAAWALAFLDPSIAVFAAVQLWFSGTLLACWVRRPRRWLMLFGLLLLTLVPLLAHELREPGVLLAHEGPLHWLVVLYGLLFPLMLLTSLWVWQVVRRLDEARHLAADLAVTQERLRFASDLHDIQGHHLQVIALKAELAERTLASAPAQAAAQVGEIRLIAKEAMEETRSLVAGLREVGLTEELENASDVLTLAGAECRLTVTGMPTDPQLQRVLAFAVREATTNILRHAQASEAELTLTRARGGFLLLVSNNGVGSEPSESGDGAVPGSGLAGLRERLAAVGGTLSAVVAERATATEAGPGAPAARFELTAWVPNGGAR
ncbi:sensor histidine kinase [Leucobacter chromiireducens]|uniref:sensor histidine kinase n=1 Tax=Leucobacter chromiireducens TaxID=283877 RepID=UPI000F62EF9C|nr:histidine kinase [Leucobacter chromiireducens]